MSLSSGVISSHAKTPRLSPTLILVALVVLKILLGALADRVGREVQADPASDVGAVAWDDRNGNPVVLNSRP